MKRTWLCQRGTRRDLLSLVWVKAAPWVEPLSPLCNRYATDPIFKKGGNKMIQNT